MITIVPYQTKWPGDFLALGKDLRRALGDRALRIDHIGSTSVQEEIIDRFSKSDKRKIVNI
jgi:GrpB-like predicted nucleotidyltransferase (UPF0157 family)